MSSEESMPWDLCDRQHRLVNRRTDAPAHGVFPLADYTQDLATEHGTASANQPLLRFQVLHQAFQPRASQAQLIGHAAQSIVIVRHVRGLLAHAVNLQREAKRGEEGHGVQRRVQVEVEGL